MGLEYFIHSQVKPKEVIMFSRQLAILLESGIDIVTAIDLYKTQAPIKSSKKRWKKLLPTFGGAPLSRRRLPNFPKFFRQCIAARLPPGNKAVIWIRF